LGQEICVLSELVTVTSLLKNVNSVRKGTFLVLIQSYPSYSSVWHILIIQLTFVEWQSDGEKVIPKLNKCGQC
jgi:hypothetical protein